MMKKISSLFLVVIIASIFAIPAYAAFKVNALTGDLDYYESGLTSSSITSLTERSDTSGGSLDAAYMLWNSSGVNYKMTGENVKDWLTQEGFGAGATITDLDDLPGDTVDDNLIDFVILAGVQAADTELSSIAGLTFADASIIQLTGAGASAVLTSGGNNYILGSNSDNSALEFKTPANVLTQIGAAASSHSHTGADLSGIDISDDTNLAGTANQITLTGDTLSLASAITLPGTLAGGDGITAGGITFDSSPDTAGDLGYSSGYIFYGANSESLTLLPGSASNTATLTSATGIDSLDMGDIALTVKSLTIERVAGTVGSSTWYEDPDDGDMYVKAQISADGMTESTTYTWPKAYPTADGMILTSSSLGIWTWTAGGGTGIANIVEDTTPQLGGDLDAQAFNITGTGYISLGSNPGDSGALRLSNNTAISWEQSTPGTDIFIALDGSDILQVGQNCADIRLGTSGTGNVTVTGDLTVTGSDVSLGAAGVKITGDGDGAITLLGLGDGYDEDLTINLDDTENTAKVSTSTGLATIDFGTIDINLPADSITADELVDMYEYDLLPVAWTTAGVTAPGAINNSGRGPWVYRDFADDADNDLNFVWQIPSDATVGGSANNFWFRVHYLVTNATGPSASEGVAFSLSGVAMGNNDATNAATGSAVTVTDDELNAAQWDYMVTDWSSAVTLTGSAAGEMVEFNFERTTGDAVDDYGQDVGVAFIEIRYVKNPAR